MPEFGLRHHDGDSLIFFSFGMAIFPSVNLHELAKFTMLQMQNKPVSTASTSKHMHAGVANWIGTSMLPVLHKCAALDFG